jgi:transposase
MVKAIDDVHGPRVAALLNEGFTLRGIADLTGLSKSTVYRLKRRMREEAAGQIQRTAGTA